MQQNMLNQIQIGIDKAVISGIKLDFDVKNGLPNIQVDLDLLSVGGQKITGVSLGTGGYCAYNESTKLDKAVIDPQVWVLARELMQLISPNCVRKINAIDKLIEAPAETEAEAVAF